MCLLALACSGCMGPNVLPRHLGAKAGPVSVWAGETEVTPAGVTVRVRFP